jgi:hypothetical protein
VVSEVVFRHGKPEPESAIKLEVEHEHPHILESVSVRKTPTSPASVVVEMKPPAIDMAPVKRALNKRDFIEAERLLEELLDQAPDSPCPHAYGSPP